MLQSEIFLCIRIDLKKSVQICKHLLKFDQASSTGTALPLPMKQITMKRTCVYKSQSIYIYSKHISDVMISSMLVRCPIKWRQRTDMVIAVAWDVKRQLKQTKINKAEIPEDSKL